MADEAVYALQEVRPGLEKVFFTLQQELLKPQAQAVYKPNQTLDTLVREPELASASRWPGRCGRRCGPGHRLDGKFIPRWGGGGRSRRWRW